MDADEEMRESLQYDPSQGLYIINISYITLYIYRADQKRQDQWSDDDVSIYIGLAV
jgi:hypothetical protein